MATKALATRTVLVSRPRRRRRSSSGFTLPLAVVAGFTPLALDMWNVGYQRKDQPGGRIGGMLHMAALDLAAYNTDTHAFDANHLGSGWGAIVLGVVAHKAANILGLNRMLARAKVPFIRI